ncbi:MAG: DNA adenine methylase [Candidatus Goldbacteria bacterium]|nr:DNA adenine methylase [Candidatus Goldiibacteriota bacterium]
MIGYLYLKSEAALVQLQLKENELKEKFPIIEIMRFMGNKKYLIDFIVPEIIKETNIGDTIFDLTAGTQSISYALKKRNQIYSNDVLTSSYTVGKAFVENNKLNLIRPENLRRLKILFDNNLNEKKYSFFYDNYPDTYFSAEQCLEIDSIRYAIDYSFFSDYEKAILLSGLIYSMCYAQSSPGHFAQFMPKDHPRVIKLRKISIFEQFEKKINEIHIVCSKFENKVFNCDYRDIFNKKKYINYIKNTKLFYLDPPYTAEQYSRFYHLLETVVKYDSPDLQHKAKYRTDRFKSAFSYKTKVKEEFEYVLSKISEYKDKKIIISYSNNGLVLESELKNICKKYFTNVSILRKKYDHCTQGKGKIDFVYEILLICNNI